VLALFLGRPQVPHGTEPLMLEDCRRVPDGWHDCQLALRALGVELTDELAKVAHFLSWYQQNKDIAKGTGFKLPKIKILVHDVLVLLGVDDRAAAAIVIRNAVEAWRSAAPDHPSRCTPPAPPPKSRRPRTDPDIDGHDHHDHRRPAPDA